jgi:hypothetical protein
MTDSTKILTCPACGKEMEKIFIERLNCNIDICTNGCGGIFFDNREFQKFDEEIESIDEIQKALEGKTFEEQDQTFKRICPACGMKMVKNSTSIKGEIIVDDCYNCGGKFLDYKELDKIRAEFPDEASRSKATMDYLKEKMGAEFDEMHAHKLASKKETNKPKSFIENIINKFF